MLSCPQLQHECPRLGDITKVILEELCGGSGVGTGVESSQIRHIVEGLLAHFFSLHQTSYHPEDVRWLLNMANLQSHWQATYLMSTIVEVGMYVRMYVGVWANVMIVVVLYRNCSTTCSVTSACGY